MGKKLNALRKQVKSMERQLKAIKEEVAALRSPAKAQGKSKKKLGKQAGKKAPARKALVKSSKAGKAKIANSAAVPPVQPEVPALASEE